jgi:hypothetical protein
MQLPYVLLLVFVTACGSGTVGGDSCTKDGDCQKGVSCLHDKHTDSMTMCVDDPGSGICSLACTTHAQCKTYGATFKCALAQTDLTCNPTGICKDNYSITCTGTTCREAPEN